MEQDSKRILKLAESLLNDPDFNEVSKEERAYSRFIVAIAQFISQSTTYCEIKNMLKLALIEADNDLLRGMILHNLAVVNYCELMDHNEAVANGDDMDETE